MAISKRPKWKILSTPGSLNRRFRLGAFVGRALELHDVRVAVAGRQLYDGQGVAVKAQAHGLGVDRHRRAEIDSVGQVAVVQMHGHERKVPVATVMATPRWRAA